MATMRHIALLPGLEITSEQWRLVAKIRGGAAPENF
jgi:hypothetical protein